MEAQTLLARERFADAATLLVNAKSLIRDDKEARLMLAVSYYQINQLDKALEHLKAMTEATKSPYQECWLYLGQKSTMPGINLKKEPITSNFT